MDPILAGKVIKEWGLNGELKIMPINIAISEFEEIDSIMLSRDTVKEFEQSETFEILNKKYLSNGIVVTLKGIDTIESARVYRHAHVLIDAKNIPKLGEGEYFKHEIIGLNAITISGENIGRVTEILQTSANDIFIIKDSDKEILIPAVKAFIDEINIEKGYVKIIPIEGLL